MFSSNTEIPKTSIRKKLVIIGDGAVGKTCLIQSFFKNKFSSDYETTVFETYVTNIQIESNDIELVIWVKRNNLIIGNFGPFKCISNR